MRLHFDCFSGVSGDMILGSLVDVGLPFNRLVRGLKALPVEGFRLRRSAVMRGALAATKVDVDITKGFGTPLTVAQIRRILNKSTLPTPVKEKSQAVFDLLAQAEGKAHRVDPHHVHFHEVGVIDSFVDVVGGVLGLHLLGADRITASPINVGSGTVQSAHGSLPVPGPAVAALAAGLPIYVDGPARELATPTGVALLKTMAQEFRGLPPMQVRNVGYGAGTAEPHLWPNVLRVFVGDEEPDSQASSDTIVELQTNIDDLNPQVYESVFEQVFAAGALDATLTPVTMKKGRPGIVLSVLVPREKVEPVLGIVFAETTALGIRLADVRRRILPRRFETVSLRGGLVRIKLGMAKAGRTKAAPEYEDCRRIAERTGRPVKDILEEAVVAYRQGVSEKAKVRRTK
ncbi:MAG: nickel pincer cofactor biosynthesis protein LarC [Nitrospiraceae bacterium]